MSTAHTGTAVVSAMARKQTTTRTADAAHPSSPPPAAARYAAAWRLAHGSHRRCAEAAAVSMPARRRSGCWRREAESRGGEVEGEVEEHSSQQQSGKVLEQSSRAVARRRWVVVVDDGQVVVAGASFLDSINFA